jgi:hypothetical protein
MPPPNKNKKRSLRGTAGIINKKNEREKKTKLDNVLRKEGKLYKQQATAQAEVQASDLMEVNDINAVGGSDSREHILNDADDIVIVGTTSVDTNNLLLLSSSNSSSCNSIGKLVIDEDEPIDDDEPSLDQQCSNIGVFSIPISSALDNAIVSSANQESISTPYARFR